jgi:hypothetical protein
MFAFDNDVLIKGACFGLLEEMAGVVVSDCGRIAVLGAAPFVVKSRIGKILASRSPDKALDLVSKVFGSAQAVEPTAEETKLASEFEHTAVRLGLMLDSGESLLCAVCVLRTWDGLATGDKRAVCALEQVLQEADRVGTMQQRVIILEQLMLKLLDAMDPVSVRTSVCAERELDRALSNCFSCSSPNVDVSSWKGGLNSYIRAVREGAPQILMV